MNIVVQYLSYQQIILQSHHWIMVGDWHAYSILTYMLLFLEAESERVHIELDHYLEERLMPKKR